MARAQGSGNWEGCNKFGKASDGSTVKNMNIMDLRLYFSCQMGAINGFQENCDTITSIR